MQKKKEVSVVESTSINQRIFIIRGMKVMLDFHLADLYQVPAKRLNEQVKRNIERFPEDFMFQLTKDEIESIGRSQFATASASFRNARFKPYVFTEQGIAMLSSVLHSPRAIQTNIFIIRAFAKLREILPMNADLALKIGEIEKVQNEQGERLDTVYDAVKSIMDHPIDL